MFVRYTINKLQDGASYCACPHPIRPSDHIASHRKLPFFFFPKRSKEIIVFLFEPLIHI